MPPKLKVYLNINNLVLAVAMVVTIIMIVDTIRVINRNIYLSQESSRLSADNKLQEMANQNQKLNIEYLKSDAYLDLAVRDKLGISAPGDKELIFTDLPEPEQLTTDDKPTTEKHLPFWRENIESWIDFLLRRQPTSL